MSIRDLFCFALLLFLGPSTGVFGQDLKRPAEWRVRTDDPAADAVADLWFVSMPPGWHITSGPAAILWDASRTASGSFRIEAEGYRFAGESADGYGILLGGSGLDTDSLQYLAFLVDRGGRYRIYHRAGSELHEIQPWTNHDAIVARDSDPAADNAQNVLAVEVGADSLRFEVNGEAVATYARMPYIEVDGQVGLRVHDGVDVHITRLDVIGRETARTSPGRDLSPTSPDSEIPEMERTWDAIEFDLSKGEVPEGIAFDGEGRLFVGLAPLGKILRIAPDGTETTFASLLAAPIPAGGPPGLLGVASTATGDLYAALVSFDPATHGVYRIDGRTGAFERLPGSQAICWPNALVFDPQGNLYVTESTRVCSGEPAVGAVWRIPPGGSAEPWVEDPALAGTGALGLQVPIGANGIAFRPDGGDAGTLIVANTETGALLSIPVGSDGSPGEVETLIQDQRILPLDGIVLDADGAIYAMVIGQNTIVRVTPDGTDLAVVADQTMGLVLPVNAAFGTRGEDRQRLFVTNFALRPAVLPDDFPPPKPGIVVIDVGGPRVSPP